MLENVTEKIVFFIKKHKSLNKFTFRLQIFLLLRRRGGPGFWEIMSLKLCSQCGGFLMDRK